MKRTSQFQSSLWNVARRIIFIIATLITLVTLFYVFENWRGRHAWEKYKAELTSRGELLRLSDYASSPVPADQNFAETPLLQAIAYKNRTDAAVWAKFQRIRGFGSFSPMGTNEVRSENAAEILEAFKDIEPELAELRMAAKRPFARFTNNHANAFLSDSPNFIVVRTLTQLLIMRAFAELASGGSERAFEDIEVVRRLADSLSGQSTLVSAMIRVAILGLTVVPFEKGLSAGAWSDRELVAFQKYFESVDLLSDFDAALRGGERNGVTRLVEDLPRQRLMEMLIGSGKKEWKDHVFDFSLRWCPRGWLFQNAVSYSRSMQRFFEGYDVRQQRVFPEKCAEAMTLMNEEIAGITPFKYLAELAVPNVAKAAQVTAQNQTLLHEAAIACALERYHRARGEYPESLSALAPAFMEKLPTDLMTGEPLKYRRTSDGKYHLYSIGWNLKDEGGKRVSDRLHGDWAWPPAK